MHLNFSCPFFFQTEGISDKLELVEIAKKISAQQKMTCVTPRQTRAPSIFLRKKHKKDTFQLMTTIDMIFRVKINIFTHFSDSMKVYLVKKSIN